MQNSLKSNLFNIIHKPSWELKEQCVTDEEIVLNRRQWLKRSAALSASIASAQLLPSFANAALPDGSFPATLNPAYKVNRPITSESDATEYNNFYEFGSHKNIAKAAQKLKTDPWTINVDGLAEKTGTFDLREIAKLAGFEQRIYRFRCVEAWAMVVPWDGIPLAKVIQYLSPSSSARYVQFETLADEKTMPGLKQFWYPWPYTEGLTIEEATNELAFLAFGMYGKKIPKQNGAPVRLVTPWKYGFKNIKSIMRISFTKNKPNTFWENIQENEYGFWANVNPEVSHPRWSQATERMLGTDERVPTLPWNGYAKQVAHLYDGMEAEFGDKLYR